MPPVRVPQGPREGVSSGTPVRASPKSAAPAPAKARPSKAVTVSGGGGLEGAAIIGGGGLASIPAAGGGGLDTQAQIVTGR